MAELPRVEQWLIGLGRLTAARLSSEDATNFIDRHAAMLASRFPDAAFSHVSLEHVAAECRYLPTYGEIVALLRGFLQEHRVATRPLALNDNVTDVPPEQRYWVAYWHQREAEGFAPLREDDGRLSRPDVTDWREHTASLIRRVAPAAWAHLLGEQNAA
jgi:hypothetical protein